MAMKNLYKHLVNFTSKPHRPVLTGFHFTEDGDIEATNSHIYAKLHRCVPAMMEDFILCPKTLKNIGGEYPECSRLIPQEFETETCITSETAKELAKWAKVQGKEEIVRLTFRAGELELSTDNASVSFPLTEECEELSLLVKAENLKIVCEFLRDATEHIATIKVGLNGALKPIRFYVEDVYDVLLTPVREK